MDHHVVPKSTYYVISLCLAVLMIATVAAAQIDLGYWNVPLALAIACTKAALIILFFMHVLYSPPLVKLFAAGGFFWLLLLFAFTFADVYHRS